MLPVHKIMTKEVVTVTKDTCIYEAIDQLVMNQISGLAVVDDKNNLVGILSEWDILHLLTENNVDQKETVEHYMTFDVISFTEDDRAADICEFFQTNYKRRVPIVRDKKLVGIVSRHDIIKLVLSLRRRHKKSEV